MKKNTLIVVILSIVLFIAVGLFTMRNQDRPSDISTDDNGTIDKEPAQAPLNDEPKNDHKKQLPLTEGMMLSATGTISQLISDSGGLPDGDPDLPPTLYLITLDDSPVGGERRVRITNKGGCIDDNLFVSGDKVVISGTIVKIIEDTGIILTCEKGARVERIQ